MDEVLIGDQLLKSLGIDVDKQLASLAVHWKTLRTEKAAKGLLAHVDLSKLQLKRALFGMAECLEMEGLDEWFWNGGEQVALCAPEPVLEPIQALRSMHVMDSLPSLEPDDNTVQGDPTLEEDTPKFGDVHSSVTVQQDFENMINEAEENGLSQKGTIQEAKRSQVY